jgi:hypothetical protein
MLGPIPIIGLKITPHDITSQKLNGLAGSISISGVISSSGATTKDALGMSKQGSLDLGYVGSQISKSLEDNSKSAFGLSASIGAPAEITSGTYISKPLGQSKYLGVNSDANMAQQISNGGISSKKVQQNTPGTLLTKAVSVVNNVKTFFSNLFSK